MSNKHNSIAKSAILVTVMMLSFKILGFIKQAFIAYYFGATLETDTYFIAWGFVSGVSEAIVKALSVSLVAVYTGLRLQKGKDEAAKLVNGLIEILFPLFTGLAIILFIASPFFTRMLAPSYSGQQYSQLVLYIRILAPVLVFGSLELILGAMNDSYKSFYIPRLQSLIYSLVIILSCVFLSELLGVGALILGQYASSVVFAIILIISVSRWHKFALVRYRDIPELKSILVTAIPLFIGNSALQINQIVDKSITSGLGEGAASALSYCHTLEQFVTNIMIVNIGNVMFANFAEFVAKKEDQNIVGSLSKAINILIIILTGISIITIFSARDIVSIVYYRGSFTQNAVKLTSLALIGYAISFVCVAVRDLSVKSLYAFKDTKSPMISCIICIAINIFFSILLSRMIGILGVSIATSISAFVGMILNARSIKRHLKDYKYFDHFVTFLKCCPAAIVLALICYVLNSNLSFGSLLRFIVVCVIGFGAYFTVLYIQGINEIREVAKIIRLKLTR